MTRRTIFISDCHLQDNTSPINTIFINYLSQLCNVDALYILGDLFEAWIGDDDISDFHTRIIASLRALTSRGIPVFILHGNRDFLLGKKFLKQSGAHLLPDETLINLYGEKTLLMHGDSLCTDDKAYLAFKKKVRNPIVKFLFRRKSLQKRQKMAMALRNRSREHQLNMTDAILDVSPEAVKKIMSQHRASLLIHGHTHRPAIHTTDIEGYTTKRIVLGAWHTQGNALTVTSDHQYLLQNFS